MMQNWHFVTLARLLLFLREKVNEEEDIIIAIQDQLEPALTEYLHSL